MGGVRLFRRAVGVAVVALAMLVPSGHAGASDTTDGEGFDAAEVEIVVDRDAATVDVDGDGVEDWFGWGAANTHLPIGPRPNHPGQVFTPRLEWDLDGLDVARVASSKVVVTIEQGTEWRRPGIAIQIDGQTVSGRGSQLDITREARAWADRHPEGGTFVIDVTSGYPIRTLEFDPERAARLLISDATSPLPTDRLLPIAGCSRYSCPVERWSPVEQAHFAIELTGPMRATLDDAQRIELAIRLLDCEGEVDLVGQASRDTSAIIGHQRAPTPFDAEPIASDITARVEEGGLRYIDITGFVKANLDDAALLRIDPIGQNCTVLLGSNSTIVPRHRPYEIGLAVDGHRYAPSLSIATRVGSLATCSAELDATGLVRVSFATDDDVVAEVYRSNTSFSGSFTLALRLPQGSWLDFSNARPSDPAEYSLLARRGEQTEIVRCGRVRSTAGVLDADLVAVAEGQLNAIRSARVEQGQRFAVQRVFGGTDVVYDLTSGEVIDGQPQLANRFLELREIADAERAAGGRPSLQLDASGVLFGGDLLYIGSLADLDRLDAFDDRATLRRATGSWDLLPW